MLTSTSPETLTANSSPPVEPWKPSTDRSGHEHSRRMGRMREGRRGRRGQKEKGGRIARHLQPYNWEKHWR